MREQLVPAITRNQKIYFDWVVDLLIYIVIINLFAQFSSAIYIRNFTFSILIALLIKIILFVVFQLEHEVSSFFNRLRKRFGKVLNIVVAFLILFISKFIIIEISSLIFGGYVEIGNIFVLFLMIFTMIITGKLFEEIYRRI